jgi:hypothetical protein
VNRHSCSLHGIALALAIAAPLQSQGYPFSQRGTVSQTVAFTDVKVTYGRPAARGRVLFGKLVPWDSIWHPGADSATRISFTREVLLEGQRLAPGEYSVWIIPRAGKPWTVILNRKAHVFHSPYPGSQFDVLRTDVSPESAMPMESMAFYFPMVLRDSALLRIHWGTTMISLRIKAPHRPQTVAAGLSVLRARRKPTSSLFRRRCGSRCLSSFAPSRTTEKLLLSRRS